MSVQYRILQEWKSWKSKMSVQNILSIILWSWYSGVQLQLSEGERARKDVVTTTAGGLTKWRGRGYGWVDYGWWGVSHPLAEELVLCEGESGRQKHHGGPQVRSVHLQKNKRKHILTHSSKQTSAYQYIIFPWMVRGMGDTLYCPSITFSALYLQFGGIWS